MTAAQENHMNSELLGIPQSILQQFKQEMGIGAKDLSALTLIDKVGSVASSGHNVYVDFFLATDTGYVSTTEVWRRPAAAKQSNSWSFEPDDATSQPRQE
jgi:hypothetical protein